MDPVNLKLYGLQRSGTNWIANNIVLTWGLRVRVWHNRRRVKHFYPEAFDIFDGYIITLRHPVDWMAAAMSESISPTPEALARAWNAYARCAYEFERNNSNALVVVYNPDDGVAPLVEIKNLFHLPKPYAYRAHRDTGTQAHEVPEDAQALIDWSLWCI